MESTKDENKLDEPKILPVMVKDSAGNSFNGSMAVREWSDQERNSRALKKSGKILGALFGGCLVLSPVHILWPIIIPTLVLGLLASFPLYLVLKGERITFFYVKSHCPTCKMDKELRPYVNSRADQGEVVVQCPDCGQTVRAKIN